MKKASTLTAKKREQLGSRYSKRVRQAGGLPAVMYGHGQAPISLTLDARLANSIIKSGQKVFTLQVEGESEEQTALLKEIQFDYLGDSIVHVDFARVDMNEQVEVTVPVKLLGEAEGLKMAGAVLMHPISELDIRCRVTAIPDRIEVDVSALQVEESIHIREIVAPEGVEILNDPDGVVATIHVKAEEPTAEQTAVEGATAEPEVIREKKAEGEEAEGGKDEKKKGKE